jgi:hypothetical protein
VLAENLDNDCSTRSIVLGMGLSAIDWAMFFGVLFGDFNFSKYTFLIINSLLQNSTSNGRPEIIGFGLLYNFDSPILGSLAVNFIVFRFTTSSNCCFAKHMYFVINSSQVGSASKSIIPIERSIRIILFLSIYCAGFTLFMHIIILLPVV